MVLRTKAVLRAAIAACVLAPTSGAAQSLASESATVSQTVGGTTITVSYYRPVARGRKVFGEVVKWGSVWTPGANWATTIEVNKDVLLNGCYLPRGEYSVWMQVRQDADWIVMLNKTARVFHVWPPSPEDEQLRLYVTPDHGTHVEVLTWSFPEMRRDGTSLHLRWGMFVVRLDVSIDPIQPTIVTDGNAHGSCNPSPVR